MSDYITGREGVGIDRRCRHFEGEIYAIRGRAITHARFLISKKREGRISFCSRPDRQSSFDPLFSSLRMDSVGALFTFVCCCDRPLMRRERSFKGKPSIPRARLPRFRLMSHTRTRPLELNRPGYPIAKPSSSFQRRW